MSIDSTEYTLSAIADGFGVPTILGNTTDVSKIQLNLPHQFSIDTSTSGTGIFLEDNGSSCTWRTDVSEETTAQQNSNKSNNTSLTNNPTPVTTIITTHINNNLSDNSGDQFVQPAKKLHPQSLKLPLTIDGRDLVMLKNFGPKDPSTIGVCTFLPCGGSQHHCIPHLPNIKMGNKRW